jgi:FkbM family methyltransferase|tara:strand:- start:1011 stop:2024 length:1014 start_codon:yes stop_codon:yes gene_type:complete
VKIHNSLENFRVNYLFTYLDIGSRWGINNLLTNLFPKAICIGFEPDPVEFEILQSNKSDNEIFYPFALSNREGFSKLYITESPDWSSLYEPDTDIFNKFNGLEDFHYIKRCENVHVISIDKLLNSDSRYEPISRSDYIKIDVQGGELDVLKGSKTLLKSFVAIEVEVEFLQIYKNQPTFDKIHKFLLNNGYFLFDLSRNRCFRNEFNSFDNDTKGQLIWGDAIYLKDYHTFIDVGDIDKLFCLFWVSLQLGFFDYGYSIIQKLYNNGIVDNSLIDEAVLIFQKYALDQRKKTYFVDALSKVPFGKKIILKLLKWFNWNNSRMISLSHPEPEFYFRRD